MLILSNLKTSIPSSCFLSHSFYLLSLRPFYLLFTFSLSSFLIVLKLSMPSPPLPLPTLFLSYQNLFPQSLLLLTFRFSLFPSSMFTSSCLFLLSFIRLLYTTLICRFLLVVFLALLLFPVSFPLSALSFRFGRVSRLPASFPPSGRAPLVVSLVVCSSAASLAISTRLANLFTCAEYHLNQLPIPKTIGGAKFHSRPLDQEAI